MALHADSPFLGSSTTSMTCEEPAKQPAEGEKPQHPFLPTDLSFYGIDSKDAVGDAARKLLEEWSGIPKDKVDEHISAIREKAFKIYPYPCIGMYRFLDLSILSMPDSLYSTVLSRLRSHEDTALLDLGCCFGQEVRQLALDGAPSARLYGVDLRPEFLELGYELFRDRGRLQATFFAADVFDDDDPASRLSGLHGRMDVVYAGSFFHLFDYERQLRVTRRVVKLLKPAPGSLLVGRQVGNENPGEYARTGGAREYKRYRHNEASWKEMWDRVGRETGTRWDVRVEVLPWGAPESLPDGLRKMEAARREAGTTKLRFVVTRL